MASNSTISYALNDFYESYKKYTDGNELYYVDRKTFINILKDYFKYLSDEIIDNAKEVRLPARMGTLCVIKKKPTKYNHVYLRVDFNETRKNNKTILHLNDHSNGYNFKFFWSKKDILLENKSLYELIMCRSNKRRLAHAIKNNKQDFIEI